MGNSSNLSFQLLKPRHFRSLHFLSASDFLIANVAQAILVKIDSLEAHSNTFHRTKKKPAELSSGLVASQKFQVKDSKRVKSSRGLKHN